jgi:hypothetical protein
MALKKTKLIAAASALVAAAALATPSVAQAHGRGHYGWHYGWHKGWHHHHVANRSCYRKEWLWTSSGWRWQWTNVCDPFDLLL